MSANLSARNDYFFDAYDRDDVAYGVQPSAALAAYLEQSAVAGGRAIDLGAGAGRDTLALAAAGYHVTSVDLSPRGVDRIRERAAAAGLDDRIETRIADVREVEFPKNHYDAVIATTVLDHIEADEAVTVWQRMCRSLTRVGMIYVQVHTTEDPGCPRWPGRHSREPISETAGAVINYFDAGQLIRWAVDPAARLRVLRYEERLEWDTTHGPPHQHGKGVLVAVREDHYPLWYGQPAAFPKPAGISN